MSQLAIHVANMLAAFKRQRGVEVTYTRHNGHEIALTLVPAKKTHLIATAEGSRMRVEVNSWLILASELLDGENAFFPARGERFVLDVAGCEYEVLPPSGLPEWEWFDTTRTAIRIHSNEVTT